jgi:hypothetical protein
MGALAASTHPHVRLTSSFSAKFAMKIEMPMIPAVLAPASAKRASRMPKASIVCATHRNAIVWYRKTKINQTRGIDRSYPMHCSTIYRYRI